MSKVLNVVGAVALAGLVSDDDGVETLVGEGSSFAGALKAAQDRIRAEEEAEAGEQLIGLMVKLNEVKKNHRQRIRALNAEIRDVKGKLDGLDRAVAYGQVTDNFVPLAVLLGYGRSDLGIDSMAEFDALSTVPSGWKPQTQPAKKATRRTKK